MGEGDLAPGKWLVDDEAEMKYIVANWKGKIPDYKPSDIKVPDSVKVILCRGHNGEIGVELK